MTLRIETERLLIRRYRDADVADIAAYSTTDADFWLTRNLDYEPTPEGVRAWWAPRRAVDPATDPEWMPLVVERKADGRAVGHTGLGILRSGAGRQGTIGWLLGRRTQGQGLATEFAWALLGFGFGRLGLHRIAARTALDNAPSWRLMERLGMRREAHFRESHQLRGAWRDEVVYAMLAAEWKARGPAPPKEGKQWTR
jgi:RimJ/RimL family protein N-acetyltransferase